MLLTEGGGAQNANHSSEMRRQTDTVAQKMLLEQGGGTPGAQNANRSSEIHSLGEHEMPTVQQKYIMFGNAKCKPFSRNTPSSGPQNANRPAEIQSPGQPSRIRKSSMPYHSDMGTGRGLAEVLLFEVVRRAAIEAGAYLVWHN